MMYKVENRNGHTYIIEIDSGKEFERNSYDQDTKKICRNLNLGGGFDGKTPDFFMNRLKINLR